MHICAAPSPALSQSRNDKTHRIFYRDCLNSLIIKCIYCSIKQTLSYGHNFIKNANEGSEFRVKNYEGYIPEIPTKSTITTN